MELRWLNPADSSISVVTPINRIRVWGIGLENDRYGNAQTMIDMELKSGVFVSA